MITIVGVGALGSHVALFLRNEPEGLKVVDFDKVETKNTQAQFHSTMNLGKNKAVALRQAFQGLFEVKVLACPRKLETANAYTLLSSSALVIDCTDNIAARKLISTSCKNEMIPLLHGCLSAAGDLARIVWEENFVPDAEGDEKATCVDGEHLPFFAAAAAFLAVEAQNFLKMGKKRSWQLTPSGILRIA